MFAALIVFSDITSTSTAQCPVLLENEVENSATFYSFKIFHTKKFSFLVSAVCEIFAIKNQYEFVAKGNVNYC